MTETEVFFLYWKDAGSLGVNAFFFCTGRVLESLRLKDETLTNVTMTETEDLFPVLEGCWIPEGF